MEDLWKIGTIMKLKNEHLCKIGIEIIFKMNIYREI